MQTFFHSTIEERGQANWREDPGDFASFFKFLNSLAIRTGRHPAHYNNDDYVVLVINQTGWLEQQAFIAILVAHYKIHRRTFSSCVGFRLPNPRLLCVGGKVEGERKKCTALLREMEFCWMLSTSCDLMLKLMQDSNLLALPKPPGVQEG